MTISSSIVAALAERDAAAKRAAAELVWRAIIVEAGYGTGAFDPHELGAALAALGKDAVWVARCARGLSLVRVGEAADAPGGAVERAKAAMAAATAALDAHNAKIKAAEDALAALKRETFGISIAHLNAQKAVDAAVEQVRAAEQRREAIARDETLHHVGGWSWLASTAREAEKNKDAAKAVGGAA